MTGGVAIETASLGVATGLDLDSFRREHVVQVIRRALDREGVQTEGALRRLLRADDDARRRFRRAIAVSVSGLFRDPAQFDLLERSLLPELLERGRRLTVWSAGCSDGSELASIALVLERLGALDDALLLGSDLLEENLVLARAGDYEERILSDELKTRLRWERRDLVRDGAPGGGWRLVLCRNVAIYLSPDARTALHRTLASSLSVGGILLLGRSERLVRPSELGLEPAGAHAYRRVA